MESKEQERERIGREVRSLCAEMLAAENAAEPELERLTDDITTQVMQQAFPGEVVQVQALIPAAGKIACQYRRRDVVPSKHDRIGFYSTGPAFALLDRL